IPNSYDSVSTILEFEDTRTLLPFVPRHRCRFWVILNYSLFASLLQFGISFPWAFSPHANTSKYRLYDRWLDLKILHRELQNVVCLFSLERLVPIQVVVDDRCKGILAIRP